MNYMRLYFDHDWYRYNYLDGKTLGWPNKGVVWIYKMLDDIDGFYDFYTNTDSNLIKKILNPEFTSQGFNSYDLCLDRSPFNPSVWYIYNYNPVDDSAFDEHGNYLLLHDENKIYDLLTPENSLKISQDHLIFVLEKLSAVLLSKPRPPFMLIWQNNDELFDIETFDTKENMDQRIIELEKLNP